jgi:DNA-directed RNA polymerase specialized sigma24 family protein
MSRRTGGADATKGVVDTMTTDSEPGHGRPDPSLSAIVSERRQLINLRYRLLGSLADAEDVVQETYARWCAMAQQQQDAIESPGGWLAKVASRICLDLLGSARARRERYVGEWIPEPLPDRTEWTTGRSGGTTVDPAGRVSLWLANGPPPGESPTSNSLKPTRRSTLSRPAASTW